MILFVLALVVLAVFLVLLDDHQRARKLNTCKLRDDNNDLRALLRLIQAEAQAQTAAGTPGHDHILWLIDNSELLPTRKEKS